MINLPDSWHCVDCGTNTAPGCSTRAEAEAAFARGEKELKMRIDDKSEVYTVRRAIWKRARMEPFGGCLCIGCLEKRLGRKLRSGDFLLSHEFNKFPGTPRLLDRRRT